MGAVELDAHVVDRALHQLVLDPVHLVELLGTHLQWSDGNNIGQLESAARPVRTRQTRERTYLDSGDLVLESGDLSLVARLGLGKVVSERDGPLLALVLEFLVLLADELDSTENKTSVTRVLIPRRQTDWRTFFAFWT
jgi:hypothetical protein